MIASCVMLILAIFGMKIFEGLLLRILLSCLTLALGLGFSLIYLQVIKRNKILAIIGQSLLAVSVFLVVFINLTGYLSQV